MLKIVCVWCCSQMSGCTSPRKRWVLHKDGKPCQFNPDTGKPVGRVTSFDVEFLDSPFGYEYVPQVIPCGECIQCRLHHAAEMADRCMVELPYHDNNWFVTFTYDNLHLPYTLGYPDFDTGEVSLCGTLFYEDLQLFFKRLRISLVRSGTAEQNGLCYMSCGEYGPRTLRPHYHAIVFGLPLFDLVPVKKSVQGFTYYDSDFLTKLWGNGRVVVAPVSWDTCAYVARYTTKKLGKRPDFKDIPEELLKRYRIRNPYFYLGIEREMPRYSQKPAIGRRFYEEHKNDIYKTDKIYLGGKKPRVAKPSSYYDKLYDIDDHEAMAAIKLKRKLAAEEAQKLIFENTDLSPNDYFADRERESYKILEKLDRSDLDKATQIGVKQVPVDWLDSLGCRFVLGKLKSKTIFDNDVKIYEE